MMKRLMPLVCFILITGSSFAAEEYFYCGFSNLDGSGHDYAEWGKGTDFKFNQSKNRWE